MDQGITVLDNGKPRGFFTTLLGVWFSPGETFAGLVRRPAFWLPLLAGVLIQIAFVAVWLEKVDPGEFVKAQLVESGQWDKMPPESRTQVLEGQGKMFPIFAWVGTIVGGLVFNLVVAAVLYFVFRFFYASEVTFAQALSIVVWPFFAVGVLTAPLTLLILALKGDWNIPPQEALQANPTLLLDRGETAKPLWALLSSLDLFAFWLIALLAIGFGIASRKTTGSALWGVIVPWAVVIVGLKVLFASF